MHKLILIISLTALSFLAPLSSASAQQPPFTVQLIQTFDYPNPADSITSIGGVNGRGEVAGTLGLANGVVAGFVRSSSGHFSRPFSAPGSTQTFLLGINDKQVGCGYYAGIDGVTYGFLYSANGVISYDVPGSPSTLIDSVNDSSDFAGNYAPPDGFSDGFVSLGGIFSTIAIPGAGGTIVGGINNQGEAAGIYLENDFFTGHGFLRAPDGTLTYPIDFPGNVVQTDLEAINDRGFAVGRYIDDSGVSHGLVLQLPDKFVSFDVTGADGTNLTGINDAGEITGYYYAGGVSHGIIARVRPQ